jgi:hypothetical protein
VNGEHIIPRSPRELSDWFYEALIRSSPSEFDYSIAATALIITQTKRPRIGITISNTGANNAAVGFNPALTLTTGILLLPAGSLTLNWYYDGDLLIRPMFAISVAGATTLHVIESVLDG